MGVFAVVANEKATTHVKEDMTHTHSTAHTRRRNRNKDAHNIHPAAARSHFLGNVLELVSARRHRVHDVDVLRGSFKRHDLLVEVHGRGMHLVHLRESVRHGGSVQD